MKSKPSKILAVLTLGLSIFALLTLIPELSPEHQVLVLAFLALSISIISLKIESIRSFKGFREMGGWQLALLGIILGIIDVGIPYLFLKNITRFWVNYLYWSVITLAILIIGIWQINKWGRE